MRMYDIFSSDTFFHTLLFLPSPPDRTTRRQLLPTTATHAYDNDTARPGSVVEYFRPRKHRTAVYHEILVAYLDWIRRRGFKAAHIWSCPPQRGNNFIFWCHPLHQKTPTRDRLSGWYGNMLK